MTLLGTLLTCSLSALLPFGFMFYQGTDDLGLKVYVGCWFGLVYSFIGARAVDLRQSRRALRILFLAATSIGGLSSIILIGSVALSRPSSPALMNCGPPVILLVLALPILQWPAAIVFATVADYASKRNRLNQNDPPPPKLS